MRFIGSRRTRGVVTRRCRSRSDRPLFEKRADILAPIGASFVVVEMLYVSGVHLASGNTGLGPVISWLVVAVSAFIVYGRLVLKPIRRNEFA